MTHTPNSDASERERLIDDLSQIASNPGYPPNRRDQARYARNMLRADAETIRSLEAELFTRGELLTQKNEQLAARSAEVEALRKELDALKEWALGKGWSLATCFESAVVANQEKSRDAG